MDVWQDFYIQLYPPRVLDNTLYFGNSNPILDSVIIQDEIVCSIVRSKRGKAAGPDLIVNEEYKLLLHNLIADSLFLLHKQEVEKTKVELVIPALGQKDRKEKKISRISQIHAIESKLKMMEQLPSEDFQISNEPSTSGCLINLYNQNRQHKSTLMQKTRNRNHKKNDTRSKPYFRK